MKFTLKGCEHKVLEPWGNPPANSDEYYATCVSCYERLIFGMSAWDGRNNIAIPTRKAPPPKVRCPHKHRKPVAAKVTKHMPYRDAICTDCGVIQRHPDGRGVWTDVLFYGYLIKEEGIT